MDARGTAALPLLLTTDNAVPAPGQWSGVVIVATVMPGTVRLENITIEFAGPSGASAFGSDGPDVTLANCVIRQNGGDGIHTEGGRALEA